MKKMCFLYFFLTFVPHFNKKKMKEKKFSLQQMTIIYDSLKTLKMILYHFVQLFIDLYYFSHL